jgi:hypothetical protein
MIGMLTFNFLVCAFLNSIDKWIERNISELHNLCSHSSVSAFTMERVTLSDVYVECL